MAAIHFGLQIRHVAQAKRHLVRAQLLPVFTNRHWHNQSRALRQPPRYTDVMHVVIYGSNTDRALDVLFKSGFKSLLVPDPNGDLVIEDHASHIKETENAS